MILIGDTEATGLDVNSDKVHCGVFKDFDTKEVYEFRPNNLGKMAELLNKADKVVFHNGIQFDAPILRSSGIVDIPDEKIVDTLVLSRLYYPDRELGHSVEAWGKKLGYPKVEYDSWAEFDEDMLFRCKEDVETQEKIYAKLLQERGDHDWGLAERIEHKIAKILFEQEQHGWKFRIGTAMSLVSWLGAEMERVESEIVPRLSRYYEYKGELKKPFVQSGNLSANARKWLDGFGQDFDIYQLDDLIGGPFGRIEWHTVSLSQREKLCKKLMELGWRPPSYTDKGTPQLTPNKEPCPNLMKLGDIGEKLAYYFLASHRKSQIQGWIDNCREDNRVPAAVAGMTNTGRMRHAIVTNVPKARPDMFLGAEMRGLFTCGEGYNLVGFDADALEIRLAAHYTGSQPFIKAITEGNKEKGTDPHSKVWKMGEQYGLVDRDMGKKSVYTGVYGASGKKFAQELGVSVDKGMKIREIVGDAFPGLLDLRSKVEKAARRGYLVGLDGRKVWMRRNERGEIAYHKAMNTLFQSAGGIIMKFVLCVLDQWCKKEGLDVKFVGNIHDEVQAEVAKKDVERYKQLCYAAFDKASQYFKLRCPVVCEVKVSDNWASTH